MKAVILCGGKGTRLREETEFIPKPLVKIGSMPILWHIMKIYAHYGVREFVLCLGYKGHMIKNFFNDYDIFSKDYTLRMKNKEFVFHNKDNAEDWEITFAETGESANTGARIKKIEKYINGEDFFVTYGDGVADINITALKAFHKSHGKIGTVTAVRPLSRFGVLELEDTQIKDFAKKSFIHQGRIDGGFFVFNRKIFDYLTTDDDCMLEKEPLKSLANNGEFRAYFHDGFWQCMDTIRHMELLNELWGSGERPWKIWDD